MMVHRGEFKSFWAVVAPSIEAISIKHNGDHKIFRKKNQLGETISIFQELSEPT